MLKSEFLKNLKCNVEEGEYERSIELTKRAIEQNLDIKDIARAIFEGVEAGERKAFGDLVFKYGSKAWLNYPSVNTYESGMAAWKILRPYLKPWLNKKLVIGLAKRTYHHQGCDYVAYMAELSGFEVFYLGNSVAPEVFVKKVKEVGADLLGISALYHVGYSGILKTLELLKREGLRQKVVVVVGGSMPIDIAKSWRVDGYGVCASLGVKVMKHLVGVESYSPDEVPGIFRGG